MSTAQHVCAVLAIALALFVVVLGLLHHHAGEKCHRCGRRGHVVHEGRTARCRACLSQWADGGHGYG